MKTLSWDKIQQGDEEAFRQLYEQYADLLYGYGMKIAGDDDLSQMRYRRCSYISLKKEKPVLCLNLYLPICVCR